MQTSTIHPQQASSRFQREPVRDGVNRRFALEGDARPGDVLTLAGGDLVRDLNENGLVDGWDEPVNGTLIDVRA